MIAWRGSSARLACAIAIMGLVGVGSPEAAQQESHEPALLTVHDWLEREHRFLRRYLGVVRQAGHDYRYNYKTPELLLPVAIDLFTGCVAHNHAMEERFLYPVLRPHLADDQKKILDLILHDQQTESETVKAWMREVADDASRTRLQDVVDRIDYLGQLINRHIVLHEERLYPVLEALTSKEQAEILRQIAAYEQGVFGPTGRRRYEQLLTFIEEQIDAVAGRIW